MTGHTTIAVILFTIAAAGFAVMVGEAVRDGLRARRARMGDIGTDPREFEVEPIEVPISVPEPVQAPVPEPEKVPV